MLLSSSDTRRRLMHLFFLVYTCRPERTGFNMYAENTRPQLTYILLVPCAHWNETKKITLCREMCDLKPGVNMVPTIYMMKCCAADKIFNVNSGKIQISNYFLIFHASIQIFFLNTFLLLWFNQANLLYQKRNFKLFFLKNKLKYLCKQGSCEDGLFNTSLVQVWRFQSSSSQLDLEQEFSPRPLSDTDLMICSSLLTQEDCGELSRTILDPVLRPQEEFM